MVVCIAEIDRIVDHCLKYLFIKTSSYNVEIVIMYRAHKKWGPSWPRSYGSWIYNYICNQCLSQLKCTR